MDLKAPRLFGRSQHVVGLEGAQGEINFAQLAEQSLLDAAALITLVRQVLVGGRSASVNYAATKSATNQTDSKLRTE
jgi:hypothetical protein